MVERVQTIIFKTIGTHSPEAYNLREIESPAPPFQCCVTIFILIQAPTISAYNTTTLIGEGAGEGRNVTAKLYLPDNYAQTVGVPTSFETDCSFPKTVCSDALKSYDKYMSVFKNHLRIQKSANFKIIQ